MKNNFNRDVLTLFDMSYGYPFSPEEAEIYARQAIRFGAWESVIRAIDSMSVAQKQEDRRQYWLARASEQRNDANAKAIARQIYRKWRNLAMTITICLPKTVWVSATVIFRRMRKPPPTTSIVYAEIFILIVHLHCAVSMHQTIMLIVSGTGLFVRRICVTTMVYYLQLHSVPKKWVV